MQSSLTFPNARLSPSTRRAWIEIYPLKNAFAQLLVALHPEGVDRNPYLVIIVYTKKVALHPEGVDRN